MKTQFLYLFFITVSLVSALGAPTSPDSLNLPRGVKDKASYKWNAKTMTLTFTKDVSFSDQENQDNDLEGFYYELPPFIKEVVIAKGVTVTGGFRTSSQVMIRGEERETSRIFGTDTKVWSAGENQQNESSCKKGRLGDDRAQDCDKWKYGAISTQRGNHNYSITIQSLTIENSRTYAITGFKTPFVIDDVYIVNTRPLKTNGRDYKSNSDGISGGPGTQILNTKIDTWDDAIKLYENTTVRNVTIVHNPNGAPFQFGWSPKKATIHTIENVKIVLPEKRYRRVNLSLFSVSLKSGSVDANVKIMGAGLHADYSSNAGVLLRTDEPLPWVWLKGAEARLQLHLEEGARIYLNSPGGIKGPGNLTFENSCQTIDMDTKKLECNVNIEVTGSPF